jgi:hypothetical protein
MMSIQHLRETRTASGEVLLHWMIPIAGLRDVKCYSPLSRTTGARRGTFSISLVRQ